ncbi:LysR family transcriptional regulator [Cohnella zeiphila]|uniref:LysR family transcriptional regulator n=1 Tax=Cohnella zeiphila TaxID=2761120 RepID=A0A7X0SSN4_9BACL|nr:LysR family transcriptional regulator [Cohnella zeiphila]MBB6735402.1 LysR family transcriptional regulator [Cohnella zeiphila]
MDTVGVHSFIVVTRERSISRAAQALHVTQPTLSARLRKLEDDLGVTLLERSWDGIRLTTEGRFFLSYSLQLFQELEESATLLRKRDSHEADGPIEAVTNARRLRIGVESFLYPALTRSMIEGVQQVAPEAECRFVDKTSDLLLNLIDCDGLDLCVRYRGAEKPHLISRELFEDRFVLLYPKEGFEPIGEDMTGVSQLLDKPFVLFDKTSLLVFREITQPAFMRLFGTVPERFHIVNDVDVTLDIVARGFGYTFLPVVSILQLLDEPLPFRVVLMDLDLLRLPLYLTYSTAAGGSLHPIGDLADAVYSRLRSRLDTLYPKLAAASAGG